MQKIPLIILTGFLGSGKTTLLNNLLKTPQLADSAVLVNEFGAIALDHHLIEAVPESTVVLGNGCICCAMRGELSGALRTLFWQRQDKKIPNFKRVIIETTGLADPAPILHELLNHPTILQHYSVAGVITCVDGAFGAEQLERQPESLKQAVVADQLLITKTDLASAEQIAALTEQLQALNSVATIHPVANGKIDPEIFLTTTTHHSPDRNADGQRWQKPDAYRPIQIDPGLHMHLRRPTASSSSQHKRIHSFCLTFEQPLPRRGLLTALQMLASMHGEHILRIKGIVHFDDDDKPHVIHGIQHMLFPIETLERWPQGLSGTQLVFIVEGLAADTITDMLQKFIGMDRGDRKAELTSWLIS